MQDDEGITKDVDFEETFDVFVFEFEEVVSSYYSGIVNYNVNLMS